MSEKTIKICDGCGIEVKEVSERYHLNLKTDFYRNGIEDTSHVENLDFCCLCAKEIKKTLKKLAGN